MTYVVMKALLNPNQPTSFNIRLVSKFVTVIIKNPTSR